MLLHSLPPSPGAVVARAAASVGEDARAVLIEEGLLPHLGFKALNLSMDTTGGLRSSRADVIPLPT